MKLRIVVPVVIVLALGGLLVAPGFVDWGQYRAQIQETIKESAGYSVELRGDIEVALLPSPRIMIEDIVVFSPLGEASDAIFSLKRLDVHVALSPLLRKQVQVNSIRMTQPHVSLKILKGGVQNWVLPVKPAEENSGGEVGQGDDAEGPEISFDDIKVYGGSFSFEDVAKKKVTSFDGIDLDVEAESLYGPYKIKGLGGFKDYEFSFDGAADGYDPVAKSIAPHIMFSVSPGDVKFEYSGVASLLDGIDLQGEVNLSMASVAKTLVSFSGGDVKKDLDKSLNVKGFLTGNKDGFAYKDLSVVFGKSNFSGYTSGSVSENKIKVSLDFSGNVDVSGASFPASVRGGVEYSLASGDLKIDPSDLDLNGNIVRVSGALQKAKNGTRDLLTIKAHAKNMDFDKVRKDLFGQEPKQASVGSNVAANKNKGNKKIDAAALVKPLALPLDVDFDLFAADLRFDSRDVKGVHAKGGVRANAIVFEALSVKDILGSSLSAVGGISDIAALSGVDLRVSAKASDLGVLMGALGQDTTKFPAAVKAVDVDVSLKGAVDALDVVANVNALNAKVMVKGKLLAPLDELSFEGLGVQIRHPNMAKLLGAINPDISGPPVLSNPVDVYADISLDGKKYGLSNIKGKVLGTTLSGSLTLNMTGEKPDIQGDVKLGSLTLAAGASKAALVNKKSPSSSSKSSAKSVSGRWSNAALDVDWMNGVNVDMGVTLARLKYDKWDLSNPSLRFKLRDGDLDVSRLDAGLFDGTVSLTAKMHGGASIPLKLNIASDVKIRDVDLGLLSAALSPTPLVKGAGNVSADVKLTSAGASQAQIVNGLNGDGEVNGTAIVLDGLDLTRFARALSSDAKIGDSVLGMWGGSTQGGSTSFDALSGSFVVKNGIVSFAEMDLDGPRALIETKGQVDLPRWTIATQHKITLKDGKQIPPVEMSFSGSLDNPGQTFAKGALDDYISRKINRKLEKLLIDKLGLDPLNKPAPISAPVSNGTQDAQPDAQANQPEQVTPEDALRGLLEGLISF